MPLFQCGKSKKGHKYCRLCVQSVICHKLIKLMNLISNERLAIEQLREVSELEPTLLNWGKEILELNKNRNKNRKSTTRDGERRQRLPSLNKVPLKMALQEISLNEEHLVPNYSQLPPFIKTIKPHTAKPNYNGIVLGVNFAHFERRVLRKMNQI
ncbi:unnamed protein product [Paramecium sonneborni]|uniref:Uncharacterized protein n=1 Tax=Paramecium sonneborni TaxID=65129 RepID=A0A8S1QWF1_9CILI|nr:unnamed protein product [Paramecium sonneborni]